MTEKDIQRELTKLDHGLFLDKEFDPNFGTYYCVKYNPGERFGPPWLVMNWRDTKGRPYPLSDLLLSRIRANEGLITDAIREVKLHNAVIQDKRRQERMQAVEDMAKELKDRTKGGTELPKGW